MPRKVHRISIRTIIGFMWGPVSTIHTHTPRNPSGRILFGFFISLQKVGFCSVDKKISLRFQQDFPYRIVFSDVLDRESADTKAETLSILQNCRDKKNLPDKG